MCRGKNRREKKNFRKFIHKRQIPKKNSKNPRKIPKNRQKFSNNST